MKKTLKQILTEYPMPASKIAKTFGKSREWMAGIASGAISYQTRAQHAPAIQNYLRKIGRELSQIEIVQPEDIKGVEPQKQKKRKLADQLKIVKTKK